MSRRIAEALPVAPPRPANSMLRLATIGLLVPAAACTGPPPRSDITLDSGRPLSAAMQAYEVLHYTLRHEILVEKKAIAGSATIRFMATAPLDVLELDFDGRFRIDGIESAGASLAFERTAEKLFISLPEALSAAGVGDVTVHYHGRPLEAKRAPWEGGFVWASTPAGKPWIATAMQGEGCDIWWPCKDHPSGEPAGVDMYFTVPPALVVAANGVLNDVEELDDGRKTYHWRTGVPVNTYGIALNAGPYILIEDTYESVNGTKFPVMFWALEENEAEARAFFDREIVENIEFFERRLGPYPWGQEKLGVVETPHYGMEHQTINAYGNQYRRMKYGVDYILHHELAHEWFGNLMTHATVSDLWLHEGFATFMQSVFARERLGDIPFHALLYQSYLDIDACHPIAPREPLSIQELYFDEANGKGPAGDIYDKGAWVLRSLQFLIGEEAFWRTLRRLLYGTPRPESLGVPIEPRYRSTDEFVTLVSDEVGQDMNWFFEVYARRGPLPVLELEAYGEGLTLHWKNVGDLDFPMPVPVLVAGELRRVEFAANRARLDGVRIDEVRVDPFMQILRKLPSVPTCDERRAEADPPPR